MHLLQQPYRDLYDKILAYDGRALFGDLVAPWLKSHGAEKTWLRGLARRAAPENDMDCEESWRLYALSRVIDLLSVGATPEGAANAYVPTSAGDWIPASRWKNIATLTVGEFRNAMEELGLENIVAPSFHPFFHEILSVAEAKDYGARAEISREVWPGYRIGPLLICRARCQIVAGRHHVAKAVAEASVLYWAFARNNRCTSDLSVGWGGNSQWRTSFRLDYEVDGTYFLNQGASLSPTAGDDNLEPEEKLELLRHRCFVRCAKDGSDLWPYSWGAIERPNKPLQLLYRCQ